MKIISKRQAMTIYRHIRRHGCFASARVNTNGPAASATTQDGKCRISAVYWPYSQSAARTAMARMSYYAA